jgi:aminobenzoyl-glutamate transport protein
MHVSVIDNWYFMASSVIVLTIVGGLITDKLVEPRLGNGKAVAMKSCRR